MKKIILPLFLFCSILSFGQLTTYPGNGKNSFGGAIGQGSLSIEDKGDSLSFALTRGPGVFDSLLVLYLDGQSGGIASTSQLTNTSTDPYMTAVTGQKATGERANLNFPADFRPEGAVVFDKNGGKVYYFLDLGFMVLVQEGASFTITPSGTNSAPRYSQTSAKSDLGISGPVSFKFIGTYIGANAYRSNEAFGASFDGYLRTSSYAPYTITSYLTFTSTALPVTLVDFYASAEQGRVNVRWSVAQETNIDEYQIQRSSNGVDFSTIATIPAKNNNASSTYSTYDAAPAKGSNYYRLLIKEKGRSEYSKVVVAKFGVDKSNFTVTQLGGKLNIKLAGVSAGSYKLGIYNSNGQLLQSTNLQHDGSDITRQVDLTSRLSKGIYRITLQSIHQQFVESILLQ